MSFFSCNHRFRFTPAASTFAALTTLLAVSSAPAAHAQAFLIGEDLWRTDISGTTTVATKIRDFAPTFWTTFAGGGAGNGNSLAYDLGRNLVMMSDAAGQNLYSYNVATTAFTSLGALTIPGFALGTDYNLAGNATFYNGKYYITPERVTGTPTAARPFGFQVEVTLNAAGTAITSTAIYGGTAASPNASWGANVTNGFGDAGDYTADPTDGKLYGFSSATANPNGLTSVAGFYVADLVTPTNGVQVRNANLLGGQAAMGMDRRLYRNNGVASLQEIDKANGNVLSTFTLTGYTDARGIADMARVSAVPEPGSGALVVVAAAALLPFAGIARRRGFRHLRSSSRTSSL